MWMLTNAEWRSGLGGELLRLCVIEHQEGTDFFREGLVGEHWINFEPVTDPVRWGPRQNRPYRTILGSSGTCHDVGVVVTGVGSSEGCDGKRLDR